MEPVVLQNPPAVLRRTAARALPWLRDAGYIMAGCLVYLIGLQTLLVPNKFLTGGLMGVAMIGHYLWPDLPVGTANFLVNLPVMALGLLFMGRRFMILSTFGMVFFSAAANWLPMSPAPVSDPMLACLFAGVICGAGCGLILKSRASAGGMDILGVLGASKLGFAPGQVVFALNALVIAGGSFMVGLQSALYSALFVYVSGRVTDLVYSGLNRRKSVLVVSNKSREIADALLQDHRRGVTFLKGEGAFSGAEISVIMTVCPLTDVPRLKTQIFNADPNAFVVVNDTLEVLACPRNRAV